MRNVSVLALSVVAASSVAQIHIDTYTPVSGVREFSGQLIARPARLDQVAMKGDAQASVVQVTAARSAVSKYTVRYIPETDEYILKVPKGRTEADLAQELIGKGAFQYIEPDWIVFPVAIPNDPLVGNQWHVAKVDAYNAWDLFQAQNSNIIVAITDTGIKTAHQDLASRLVPGANTATGTAVAQVNGGLVEDINGHGTHCAGIAAAAGDNGVGVSGMGWGLKIMPIRVTNSTGGSASTSALAAGARWAADNGARVVSTSYSGVSSSTNQTTGAYLRTKNALYLFAAGNDGANLSTFDHPDVTVVGASTTNDTRASFSAYGNAIDVFAPGVDILATIRSSNTSYGLMSGTSMATPCAAGVAAVITASNPSLTSYQVETALYQGATDIGAAGNDSVFGWGRVNLNRGLRYAYNNFTIAATAADLELGSAVSTNLSSVHNSDNVYFSGSGGSDIQFLLRFPTTLLQIGSIQVTLEHAASTVKREYTVTTASGVVGQVLAAGDAPSTDTQQVINVPLNAVDPTTREVAIRVHYKPLTRDIARWTARIDQAVLTTKP